MKIAIIGTRGVPNHYGGFEQFAEYLSAGLVKLGYDITVYNSDQHPYQKSEWQGVKIVHCKDMEHKMGTVGQFIYDFNCIKHTRGQDFDIILQLGYTSSSVWGWMLPRKKSIVTTNMDGLEWKRTKFSKPVQKFLKYAEKLGVKYSDYLISDSVGIQNHIQKSYNKESIYIPYGAHIFDTPDADVLNKYEVSEYGYNMLVARLEPENSIEIILDGIVQSSSDTPFLVVGNHNTKYGEILKNKYKSTPTIKFLGGIYDINELNNVRYFSNIYFHGHTVGGTNPSLLEAMSSNCLLCANDNIFNKSILGEDAFYFTTATDVKNVVNTIEKGNNKDKLSLNTDKVRNLYSWEVIIKQYLDHFKDILSKSN